MNENFPILRDNIIPDDFLEDGLELTFRWQAIRLDVGSIIRMTFHHRYSSRCLTTRILIPCCTGNDSARGGITHSVSPGCKAYGILSF